MIRIAQALVAATLVALALTPAAQGATTPTANAPDLVAAMAHDPQIVVSASFEERPDTGTPTGTAAASYGTTAVPTDGTTMAVLSTGEARVPADPGYVAGRDNNLDGSDVRSAFDVTVLRVVLAVPPNANCLALDFDFFSQDFGPPASEDPDFYDAFLAELDPDLSLAVVRTAGDHDDRAGQFRRRQLRSHRRREPGEPQFDRINGASIALNAQSTEYIGAMGFATVKAPVSPGSHTLDLSILDRGDGRYDSAVLLDALRVIRSVEGGCERGLPHTPSTPPPVVTLDAPANGSSSTDSTPDLSGTTTAADNTVSVKLYSGGDASGAPLQTLTGSGTGGSWQATATALAPGTYSAQASAGDGAGNEGLSAARSFTVLAPSGGPGPSPGGGLPPGFTGFSAPRASGRTGNLIVTVRNTHTAPITVRTNASEAIPRAAAAVFRYRAVARTIQPGARARITLRASAKLRRALKRRLAKNGRLVRRPRITVTNVATGGRATVRPRIRVRAPRR